MSDPWDKSGSPDGALPGDDPNCSELYKPYRDRDLDLYWEQFNAMPVDEPTGHQRGTGDMYSYEMRGGRLVRKIAGNDSGYDGVKS